MQTALLTQSKMFYYDPTFILLIPAIILAIYAQAKVHSTFNRFKGVENQKQISGRAAAQRILGNEGVSLPIEQSRGHLSDHYDPLKRVLRLSPDVYAGTSIASLAVAAHEAGHALQHAKKYWPINIRTGLFPITSFASYLAPILIIAGLIFNTLALLEIGIIFFSFSVLFTVITLPVEFNASKRALALIQQNGLIEPHELEGCKKVLSAAALTYVAGALTAILELARLIIIFRSRH